MRAAALASPLVWFANHTAQFALAPLACRWHSNLILWIIAAIALALDAVSGFVAWSAWGTRDAEAEPPSAAVVMQPWLAASGVILAVSFFLVIIAQMIPTFILGWCA